MKKVFALGLAAALVMASVAVTAGSVSAADPQVWLPGHGPSNYGNSAAGPQNRSPPNNSNNGNWIRGNSNSGNYAAGPKNLSPHNKSINSNLNPTNSNSGNWTWTKRKEHRRHDRDHGYGYGYGCGYYDCGYDLSQGYPGPEYGYNVDTHVQWCASHYRTYNPATNTYWAKRGVQKICHSPYDD